MVTHSLALNANTPLAAAKRVVQTTRAYLNLDPTPRPANSDELASSYQVGEFIDPPEYRKPRPPNADQGAGQRGGWECVWDGRLSIGRGDDLPLAHHAHPLHASFAGSLV